MKKKAPTPKRRKRAGTLDAGRPINITVQVFVENITVAAAELPPGGWQARNDSPGAENLKPVTILFLAANPEDTTRLRLDSEAREIDRKVRASASPHAVELITKWAVEPGDLLQYINECKPDIVHFSGHGTSAGGLKLTGNDGKTKTVSREALAQLFSSVKSKVRLVFLNCCFSEQQAAEIAKSIDCTIGIRDALDDDAAITFSAAFYSAIGFGCSVQEAFEQGKSAVLLNDQNLIPSLLCRPGVDANTIILVPT